MKLLEEPNLPTFAKVQMARGNVPAHFVYYKPTRDESLDYLVCYQCGFVLRLFANPPEQRFSLAGTAQGEREVLDMLSRPDSKLTGYGLRLAQMEQMACTFHSGLDINDSTSKYRLGGLPGEFSGLHLVSTEYVAFKQIAPDQIIGFDLSSEYETALRMYKKGSREESA